MRVAMNDTWDRSHSQCRCCPCSGFYLFIYLIIETTKELDYPSAEWGNNSSQMS